MNKFNLPSFEHASGKMHFKTLSSTTYLQIRKIEIENLKNLPNILWPDIQRFQRYLAFTHVFTDQEARKKSIIKIFRIKWHDTTIDFILFESLPIILKYKLDVRNNKVIGS